MRRLVLDLLLRLSSLVASGRLHYTYFSSSKNNDDTNPSPSELVVPSWQSIVSDGPLLSLFGSTGSFHYWRLDSDDGTYQNISASVPGDLLSDLMNAGIIDDPYFDKNFLSQQDSWMGTNRSLTMNSCSRTRTWIYSTNVMLPSIVDNEKVNETLFLVVEGIKMGARIAWNGVPVGVVTDQFLRYILPITAEALQRGSSSSISTDLTTHHLTITFEANNQEEMNTNGRYMACSGGWDWAPYAHVCDERGAPAYSLGIVQPLYLLQPQHLLITDVVPKIYSTNHDPLGGAPDFRVQVEVYLQVFLATSLSVRSNFSTEVLHIPITPSKEEQCITINMTASNVQLWWPLGLGKQNLYFVEVSVDEETCQPNCPTIRKRIGFRTVDLVTANVTENETLYSQSEGSGTHGFYFRVNGVSLYSRGANMIPMDQLEGRLSDEGHRLLVRSAAMANMNMIRVWGGGAILPAAFYDACDEYGILLYHDLMFVEEHNHGAVKTETVRTEIIQTVRKLLAHPSIVLWNGCNECSYDGGKQMSVYVSFVMQTVAQVDDTHAIWPSSPSQFGWEAGVNTVDGRPNGRPLQLRNNTGHDLETHGPYQRGYSATHPGVNGFVTGNTYDTQIPPRFSDMKEDGVSFRNTFVSEFGASVSSSFESMAATLSPSKWSLHGGSPPDFCQNVYGVEFSCNGTNAMAERNYPCDSRIEAFFGNISLDEVGAQPFQRQLYLCMMSQTLWMKGQIETLRSANSFGALIWQLNENWPTGGWGCVEYGPRSMLKQQVVGGRWKPLMYLLQKHLFRDVIVACGDEDRCFARNDGPNEVDVFVSIEAWSLSQRKPLRQVEWYTHLDPGRSTKHYSFPTDFRNKADVVLVDVKDGSLENQLETSAYLWIPPWNISGLSQHVNITIEVRQGDDGGMALEVRSDGLALYVLLSTAVDGHFSENSFHLRPGQRKVVRFEKLPGHESVGVDLFKQTLRVEHLGSHRQDASSLLSGESTRIT